MNRRPRVELFAPSAGPAEAAAIAAAIERFMRDHAPVVLSGPPAIDGWTRAALAEGVGREAPDELPDPWVA